MTKVKLLKDNTIAGVDYAQGDVLDLAHVTAEKLVNRKQAEYPSAIDEIVIDDPLVTNYSSDQPLEVNDDGD